MKIVQPTIYTVLAIRAPQYVAAMAHARSKDLPFPWHRGDNRSALDIMRDWQLSWRRLPNSMGQPFGKEMTEQ